MHGRRSSRLAQTSSAEPATPLRWRWFCRVDRGVDVIDRWYTGLSKKDQARFDRARDQLSGLPLRLWSKPRPASYVQQDHIYVIRFHDKSRQQWRVFGHAYVDKWWFVMSVIATERDNEYKPADAGNKANNFKSRADVDFGKNARECFADP